MASRDTQEVKSMRPAWLDMGHEEKGKEEDDVQVSGSSH